MPKTKSISRQGWKLENSYGSLPKLFFSLQNPVPVQLPKLIILNRSLALSLGLNSDELETDEGIAIFAGKRTPEGSLPLAQAYAGHQYGYFTMLGDGRALLLGEQITPLGERYDIQLKGSGRTLYSRRGDGRAALGPMLREYIISEAMHALGIPTTRSLAVVTTGETIYRDTVQPGAILTRVAASHIRVGTFEYAAKYGTLEELSKLADYTIKRHYPLIKNDENRYLSFLREVIDRQALLISKWQMIGFVHGVMNTDNMTISGETIDYGPCAFMNEYDPATVFSSIDKYGRYAFGNQPFIAHWNLAVFAQALLPLLDDNHEKAAKLAQDALAEFLDIYYCYWLNGMRAKLGLFDKDADDSSLVENLLSMMLKYHADFTNTFRAFTIDKLEDTVLYGTEEFDQWLKFWQSRLESQNKTRQESQKLMQKSNPAVIPRNHRVEEALEAVTLEGDLSVLRKLLKVLLNPYAYSIEQAEYSAPPKPSTCRYRTFCGT